MNIIVQKYGGTSVANIDRIKSVAVRIQEHVKKGEHIAVVLSAMAGETDALLQMASVASENPNPRDMDLLLSTGEQRSVAILSITLKGMGIECETFLGHQAGVITDCYHGRARIKRMEIESVRKALGDGKVAIVAGFQGVTEDGEITTIGRGGSDTSAVALAAALKAERCEIFTDVNGIYTADPNICPDAKVLEKTSYEEMMELADAGAKVLHTRAVELAAKYRVPIEVRSSFNDHKGTIVLPEDEISEGTIITGVTCNVNEAKVSIRKVPDKVGVTAAIFGPIAKAGINVDLIIQTVSEEGFTELTFTVPKLDLRKALSLAEISAKKVEAGKVSASGDIAKLSIVGLGMRSRAGIAHRMFDALAKEGINIQMIGTSEIKVSVVIDMKYADHAVRVLHKEFSLNN